ncbi:ComF family protein [Patescibacteria group bacterium]|nr:ComF family protein [Patescibacteria group bacterium]MCL5410171.1 ComF family protein [Patescibacteria group bacterium]
MSLLELILPKTCACCGQFGTDLCLKCQQAIYQADLVCPNCERVAVGGATHPLCHRKYGLDGLWSLGVYQGSLKKLIQTFKYHFAYSLAQTLASLLIEYWSKNSPFFIEEIKKTGVESWLLMPVPLYKARQNWRGFNQSEKLCQILSSKLGIKSQELLLRSRSTKQQVGLSAWQRKQNIKNAFTLIGQEDIKNKNVLLLDDVWTTGSTLKECCYVLKRAGVNRVWAVTLAR